MGDISSKRVVIIGGAYYGNRGAELMLKNSIQKIQECVDCQVTFDVWTEHSKENRELCDDSGVNIIEFVPWKFDFFVVPSLIIGIIFKGNMRAENGTEPSLLGSCRRADLFFDISMKNAKTWESTISSVSVNLFATWLIICSVRLSSFHMP